LAYELDISEDLEIVDGLDTFTLKVEGAADIVLPDCVLTEPVDTHEMEPAAGQVPQMDQLMVWRIARSPTKPPLGSVLMDTDGIYWTILAVRRKQHVACWEARARNLDVLPGIINQAVALKAVYGKGKANEAKAQWHGLFSGRHPATHADVVTCRLQPSMELAQLRFGAEFTRETYRVVVDKPLPLQLSNGEYRLVNATGERFRIMQYWDEQRIDRFPVCLAVKILEGREHWQNGAPPTPLPAPVFPHA
jgi:hypothetical protein